MSGFLMLIAIVALIIAGFVLTVLYKKRNVEDTLFRIQCASETLNTPVKSLFLEALTHEMPGMLPHRAHEEAEKAYRQYAASLKLHLKENGRANAYIPPPWMNTYLRHMRIFDETDLVESALAKKRRP